MGFVVHTSAFTAHRSAIPGKLWFIYLFFFFASVLGGNFFNIYSLIIAYLYLFTLNYQLEATFLF